jgi:hypothetical protein
MICATVEVADPPPFVAELMVTAEVVTTTDSGVLLPETTIEHVLALPAVPPVFQ